MLVIYNKRGETMIQSIVHIALVVKDYDEAIEFYTKKLHFELVEDTYLSIPSEKCTYFGKAVHLLPVN